MLQVTEDIALNDGEVDERFVRAIGSAGQNARREATAVELRLNVRASSLPREAKDRLLELAGRAVTSDGILTIVSRAHRSQADNRKTARVRLLALLRRAVKPPKMRRVTSPRREVREERLAAKRCRAAVKQLRSRSGLREG